MSSESLPLGLKQLGNLSELCVRQKVTHFANNKYVVMTPDGSPVLFAREDSGLMDRLLMGTSRALHINVFDTEDKEVMRFRRPYTMGPDKMEVCVCGRGVALVRKEFTFLKPVINVNDAADRPLFRVKGPLAITSQCDFEIYNMEKKRVGAIRKKWGGLVREAFSSADNYVIELPADLDVRYKAALLGTCFLIDFMYYEN
ncbi:PREDICTED: phospholipid scramblase 1-like [Papilio xuthus]|uniref:Phospholipid scramblase n=1 Tax=Papilio xuthus TaxID=66420 RepID=A0AAJ6ZQU9_PAPXU|nr:PREDICTED: phospholipid scramblase 1-like [Papilio xuthus]XP_013177518.1 PREDICTED: phospholipid scramblase 1-like [Papilio xuthus]XP_013177519.1 PREDICTED: phospholipid scramblase 1-like [Papilio xuthus]XP_013177520.1 PREDICTED: phospholipid scramblase 1-like [Papilio xuthus]XP_013177521.1 PREDICTED: phospholipid scramblase 1-like [Papilio xuthus]